MNDLVTIKTFTYPTELAIIRGKLESEGIDCFVKDELTIQVDNFYSNALGGIKLQVHERDVPEALEILKEGGYFGEKEYEPSTFWIRLDSLTSKIPVLKKVRVELRVLIIAAILSSILVLIVYCLTLPSLTDTLTKQLWCVDAIDYNEKSIAPYSTGFVGHFKNGCDEVISISNNGRIIFPGIHSITASGSWELYDKNLTVTGLDTLAWFYGGTFRVDIFNDERMVLKSTTTTIYAHKLVIDLPF